MASAHDRAVLQVIFNPSSPFGDIPGLNQEDELTDNDSVFESELVKQVKDLELQGVSAAESGDLPSALQHFNQAIRILPQRASAYNNRAQTKRLQGDTEGDTFLLSPPESAEKVSNFNFCSSFFRDHNENALKWQQLSLMFAQNVIIRADYRLIRAYFRAFPLQQPSPDQTPAGRYGR
uniref:Tetratricopeptide repeat protein 36 n=2 Tax=Sinocyclocheilus anshuiensis TaxID=1608454 RepID=A0A671KKN9_9TELE